MDAQWAKTYPMQFVVLPLLLGELFEAMSIDHQDITGSFFPLIDTSEGFLFHLKWAKRNSILVYELMRVRQLSSKKIKDGTK